MATEKWLINDVEKKEDQEWRGTEYQLLREEMFHAGGNTAKSVAAFTNPTRIGQEHPEDEYQITVIDI